MMREAENNKNRVKTGKQQQGRQAAFVVVLFEIHKGAKEQRPARFLSD
jgi:hypothetical protein